jgi:hypothetical protein
MGYTKDPELRKEARIKERQRRRTYKEASLGYRLGDTGVEFPQFTFKPPLHRKPRRAPFEELTPEAFLNAA